MENQSKSEGRESLANETKSVMWQMKRLLGGVGADFELSLWLAFVLLLSAVALAVIPSLTFLIWARAHLYDVPSTYSLIAWFHYCIKVFLFALMVLL